MKTELVSTSTRAPTEQHVATAGSASDRRTKQLMQGNEDRLSKRNKDGKIFRPISGSNECTSSPSQKGSHSLTVSNDEKALALWSGLCRGFIPEGAFPSDVSTLTDKSHSLTVRNDEKAFKLRSRHCRGQHPEVSTLLSECLYNHSHSLTVTSDEKASMLWSGFYRGSYREEFFFSVFLLKYKSSNHTAGSASKAYERRSKTYHGHPLLKEWNYEARCGTSRSITNYVEADRSSNLPESCTTDNNPSERIHHRNCIIRKSLDSSSSGCYTPKSLHDDNGLKNTLIVTMNKMKPHVHKAVKRSRKKEKNRLLDKRDIRMYLEQGDLTSKELDISRLLDRTLQRKNSSADNPGKFLPSAGSTPTNAKRKRHLISSPEEQMNNITEEEETLENSFANATTADIPTVSGKSSTASNHEDSPSGRSPTNKSGRSDVDMSDTESHELESSKQRIGRVEKNYEEVKLQVADMKAEILGINMALGSKMDMLLGLFKQSLGLNDQLETLAYQPSTAGPSNATLSLANIIKASSLEQLNDFSAKTRSPNFSRPSPKQRWGQRETRSRSAPPRRPTEVERAADRGWTGSKYAIFPTNYTEKNGDILNDGMCGKVLSFLKEAIGAVRANERRNAENQLPDYSDRVSDVLCMHGAILLTIDDANERNEVSERLEKAINIANENTEAGWNSIGIPQLKWAKATEVALRDVFTTSTRAPKPSFEVIKARFARHHPSVDTNTWKLVKTISRPQTRNANYNSRNSLMTQFIFTADCTLKSIYNKKKLEFTYDDFDIESGRSFIRLAYSGSRGLQLQHCKHTYATNKLSVPFQEQPPAKQRKRANLKTPPDALHRGMKQQTLQHWQSCNKHPSSIRRARSSSKTWEMIVIFFNAGSRALSNSANKRNSRFSGFKSIPENPSQHAASSNCALFQKMKETKRCNGCERFKKRAINSATRHATAVSVLCEITINSWCLKNSETALTKDHRWKVKTKTSRSETSEATVTALITESHAEISTERLIEKIDKMTCEDQLPVSLLASATGLDDVVEINLDVEMGNIRSPSPKAASKQAPENKNANEAAERPQKIKIKRENFKNGNNSKTDMRTTHKESKKASSHRDKTMVKPSKHAGESLASSNKAKQSPNEATKKKPTARPDSMSELSPTTAFKTGDHGFKSDKPTGIRTMCSNRAVRSTPSNENSRNRYKFNHKTDSKGYAISRKREASEIRPAHNFTVPIDKKKALTYTDYKEAKQREATLVSEGDRRSLSDIRIKAIWTIPQANDVAYSRPASGHLKDDRHIDTDGHGSSHSHSRNETHTGAVFDHRNTRWPQQEPRDSPPNRGAAPRSARDRFRNRDGIFAQALPWENYYILHKDYPLKHVTHQDADMIVDKMEDHLRKLVLGINKDKLLSHNAIPSYFKEAKLQNGRINAKFSQKPTQMAMLVGRSTFQAALDYLSWSEKNNEDPFPEMNIVHETEISSRLKAFRTAILKLPSRNMSLSRLKSLTEERIRSIKGATLSISDWQESDVIESEKGTVLRILVDGTSKDLIEDAKGTFRFRYGSLQIKDAELSLEGKLQSRLPRLKQNVNFTLSLQSAKTREKERQTTQRCCLSASRTGRRNAELKTARETPRAFTSRNGAIAAVKTMINYEPMTRLIKPCLHLCSGKQLKIKDHELTESKDDFWKRRPFFQPLKNTRVFTQFFTAHRSNKVEEIRWKNGVKNGDQAPSRDSLISSCGGNKPRHTNRNASS